MLFFVVFLFNKDIKHHFVLVFYGNFVNTLGWFNFNLSIPLTDQGILWQINGEKNENPKVHITHVQIANMSLSFCLHYTCVKICLLCVSTLVSLNITVMTIWCFAATLGSLEFGLHYDQESNSLHCSILKAKVTELFDKGTFLQSYGLVSWMAFCSFGSPLAMMM